MTRDEIATVRDIAKEVLTEEVEWLRSFGLSDDRIAARLGMSVDTFARQRQRATAEASVYKEVQR